MGNTYQRTESYSDKTEPKKLDNYMKCFELLSKDCCKKFNDSLIDECKKYYENDLSNYKSFVFDRMGYIYYVSEVKTCLIFYENFYKFFR
jgi:hypothetical protein